jgi:hypothetical protein
MSIACVFILRIVAAIKTRREAFCRISRCSVEHLYIMNSDTKWKFLIALLFFDAEFVARLNFTILSAIRSFVHIRLLCIATLLAEQSARLHG